MNFDQWWDDNEQAESVADLPICPDGRHTGDIVKVEFKDLKFKVSEANRDGTSLVVLVAVPKAQPVEAIIPVQYRGLISAVCKAASVHPPKKGEDWDQKQLLGRTVTIETTHGIGKTGKEFVRIDKWHPGPAPLPEAVAKKPAARTPLAKANLDADDIPF